MADKQLKEVPEDLDFLILVLHHPLVTHAYRVPTLFTCDNKRTFVAGHDVEDAEKALKHVLEDFSEAHPTIRVLVFSGHNHNYERYMGGRITYIVTGGGGATPYSIIRNAKDAYHEKGPTYHYCVVKIAGHNLKFQMFKLKTREGSAEWEMKDSFALNTQPAEAKPVTH